MGPDREAIIRAYAKALRNIIPTEYVFGLDMGLTESDAAMEMARERVIAATNAKGKWRQEVVPK